MSSKLPQLLFFLVITTTTTTHAEIRDESFVAPYDLLFGRYVRLLVRPYVIPLNEFGFITNLGRLELSLTNITTTSPIIPPENLDLSKLGFFLTTRKAWVHGREHMERAKINCTLETDLVKIIYTFDSLPKNRSYINHFSTVNESDKYTLFLGNCVPRLNVSMRIASAMYNLEGESGGRDYLSAGETVLPRVYFVLASTYLVLGCIWLFILWKERLTAFRIHFFMLAVVFVESFNSLCDAEHKLNIKRDGSDTEWIFVVFMFSFFKDMVLFMSILLIGTGWSFFKPFLQEIELFILFFANWILVGLEGSGPYDEPRWVILKRMFLIVDMVCCCLVLFPIVWSIKNIREKPPVANPKKLALLFRQYFGALICYIFVTRVVVYALEMSTSYQYLWTSVVVGKLGTLLFYIFIRYKFKPKAHYPYLEIGVATERLNIHEE